jgi:ring-1,2-phenylacetyl-CoA epoxidase subunit PaaC
VIRLGDGTEESNRRMKKALEELWPYTGDYYLMPAPFEQENKLGLDMDCFKKCVAAKNSGCLY